VCISQGLIDTPHFSTSDYFIGANQSTHGIVVMVMYHVVFHSVLYSHQDTLIEQSVYSVTIYLVLPPNATQLTVSVSCSVACSSTAH